MKSHSNEISVRELFQRAEDVNLACRMLKTRTPWVIDEILSRYKVDFDKLHDRKRERKQLVKQLKHLLTKQGAEYLWKQNEASEK